MAVTWQCGWRNPSRGAFLCLHIPDFRALTLPIAFRVERISGIRILRLHSKDGVNRLSQETVVSLADAVRALTAERRPLIIAGNQKCFSAGADLNEIAALNGPDALEFAKRGQQLMATVASAPMFVYAAIAGYCMGGGLDLALACHRRIAAPNAVFGHRGAALGLITGWGGTQRLPRLIGKGRALQILLGAQTIAAEHALQIGLIDAIADDPIAEALIRIQQ